MPLCTYKPIIRGEGRPANGCVSDIQRNCIIIDIILAALRPPSVSEMLRYSLYHHSPQAMRNTLYYRPLQRLDSPTDRKNPLVQSLLSGQILPVTGTFFPQTCLQKSRFFQPLEESSRSKPAQRPKTSSQWRNHPAYRPLCVLILTSTGGIRTQKAIDLTVRMDFHGTRMRSCGVHRRGSGGTFALGRTAWGASRCAAGVRDCCEPKRKKLRGGMRGSGSARRRDAWGGVGLR